VLDRREEILKTLRAAPVVLRALVRGADEARLRRRGAPGEWAIIEVVAHLADTEERALARVRRMLSEDNPYLDPFDQEALAGQRRYLDWDLHGELDRLERLRREHVAELEALAAPGWERTGRHGQHGGCQLSCTKRTSPPKRSITSPRSPGSCRPAGYLTPARSCGCCQVEGAEEVALGIREYGPAPQRLNPLPLAPRARRSASSPRRGEHADGSALGPARGRGQESATRAGDAAPRQPVRPGASLARVKAHRSARRTEFAVQAGARPESGSGSAPSQEGNDMLSIASWIEAYRRAWEDRNDLAVGELFTQDAIYRSHPFREPLLGREAIRAYWRQATDSLTSVAVEFGRPVTGGSRAAVEWWAILRDEDTATTLPGALILRFDRHGRCEELREYWHLEEGRSIPAPHGWGQ